MLREPLQRSWPLQTLKVSLGKEVVRHRSVPVKLSLRQCASPGKNSRLSARATDEGLARALGTTAHDLDTRRISACRGFSTLASTNIRLDQQTATAWTKQYQGL